MWSNEQQYQSMPDIALLLSQATAHHQAGRRQQAEQICRGILNSNPSQADALHQLGLLQFGNGALEEAVGSLHKLQQRCERLKQRWLCGLGGIKPLYRPVPT